MALLTTWPVVTNDTGPGTDGTVWNTALNTAQKDAIEDQVHSAANPTIKPKAVTDEVITARGSKASLDARLDVALNDDGTLKTQASLVTAADVRAGLGSRNVAVNGDLDDWTAGGAAAPDNFTLTTLTIDRTGPAQADTNNFGAGKFAAKLTRASADGALTQTVISVADFAAHANVKGQKVSVAVKVQTAIVNHARVSINDGVTQSDSDFHSGSGGVTEGTLTNVSTLTATHTISGSATKLEVLLEVKNSAGDAYFGGLVIVFAPFAPSDWQPLSAERDANATRRGLVSTGAQTIAGAKTLTGLLTLSVPPIGIELFARSAAAFTKNNDTTLAAVTGLAFAVGASETWEFEFVLKGVTTVTADWKFAVTGPAAPTAVWYGHDDSSNIGAAAAAAFGSAILREGKSASPGTEEMIRIRGLLRNGANAGSVQVQMAQNAAEVFDTIIRAESYVVARRIA